MNAETAREKDVERMDSIDTVNASGKTLAQETTRRCMEIIGQVNAFKRPRLLKIAEYRNLYAGKVKPKYRQPFNANVPTFSGTIDTLAADLNDDLSMEYDPVEPADRPAVKKLQALWDTETGSLSANASFAHKTRTDRFNALFSGRGFMLNYAASKPEYANFFEIFELEHAIFQPHGGGLWEDHLFKGRTNIVRSAAQLENSTEYDQEQVKKLITNQQNSDYYPTDISEAGKAELAKFSAMGLNPSSADYVGEALFRLAEMVVQIKGEWYYIVFSPWYEEHVRFTKLKDVFSANLYPGTSWATHEDNANFLSKSYADDLYGIADVVHTLVNQELTNRERKNFNARAYDVDMITDVAKLDAAQTRPDALVPVTVPSGKKVSDGIFTFETPDLKGTIDLAGWLNEMTGRAIGVSDLSMGDVQNVSKKATVVFAEQQSVNKRLMLRSSPYTEAMGRIGKIFIQSAKDHLPAEKALRRLGTEGEGWDAVIRRVDLDFYGDIDVRVRSSTIEMRNSALKKDARMKTLDSISADPNQLKEVNPKWLVEEKLRIGAEYDDAEIAIGMDTKNYGSQDEISYAHRGIQDIRAGRKTDLYHGATTLFAQVIVDFAKNNKATLKDKYDALLDYVVAHEKIIADNMARKAQDDARAMAAAPMPEGEQGAPVDPLTMDPQTAVRSAAQTLA